MTQHHYTPVDELRSSTRFPRERGSEVAVICCPQCEEMLVEVLDESLGGLGLFVEDAEFFAIGREVEIAYAGEFFEARVCHVQRQSEGGYVVGLACRRSPGLVSRD